MSPPILSSANIQVTLTPHTDTSVVLVDDHEVVRQGLVNMLKTHDGLNVAAHCSNVAIAMKLVEAFKPDIVITDISMPGPSVFDMVAQIKKNTPMTRVVFLTAYPTDINLKRAIQVGGWGFIDKSETSKGIIEAILKVANGEEFIPVSIRNRISEYQPRNALLRQTDNETIEKKQELLSAREIEILCFVGQGQTAKQIAIHLSISPKTVERHKSNIMAKLNIHSNVELARYAIRQGYITP